MTAEDSLCLFLFSSSVTYVPHVSFNPGNSTTHHDSVKFCDSAPVLPSLRAQLQGLEICADSVCCTLTTIVNTIQGLLGIHGSFQGPSTSGSLH